MKILILGGAGYVGSAFTELLDQKGEDYLVYDTFLYEPNFTPPSFRFIKGDIRDINRLMPLLEKANTIVHLAGISNDPSADLLPELTWSVNYQASKTLAQLCQYTKKRIIYASSCSVYGFSDNEFHEESTPHPVTLYARTKILSEQFYTQSTIDSLILRFSTIYGLSPRPRFDLVINTMVASSYFQNEIIVNGGGQWRPVVHIKDVADILYRAVYSNTHKHRIYNVGSNDQNYQIKHLAEVIKTHVPATKIVHRQGSTDNRSYRVNFDRISKDFGFTANYRIKDAVEELYDAFKTGAITDVSDDIYCRVQYLKNRTPFSRSARSIFARYYSKLMSLL